MDNIRASLIQERDEAQAELERFDELLKVRGDYGFGKGDPAVYQWEVNLVQRERYAQRLADIAASLRRLDDGTYGLCQECGQSIDDERLELLPFTCLCVSCARKRADVHAS